MKVYHRNTNFRFILLWTISVFLIVGFIVCLFSELFLVALLILGLVSSAGIFTIHGLTIYQHSISIRRYNAFGFQKRELAIPKEKLNNVEFWKHGNLDDSSSTDSWLDFLILPALFVDGKKGMTFKMAAGRKMKFYKIYLSDMEYQLVKELVQ